MTNKVVAPPRKDIPLREVVVGATFFYFNEIYMKVDHSLIKAELGEQPCVHLASGEIICINTNTKVYVVYAIEITVERGANANV